MTDQTAPAFAEWCVVELLGHRRTGAYVTEATIAGASFLRLEVPATPGHGAMTQYVSPGSVYALTPTTQELATALAACSRIAPVNRFELTAYPATAVDLDEDLDDGDDEEGGPF